MDSTYYNIVKHFKKGAIFVKPLLEFFDVNYVCNDNQNTLIDIAIRSGYKDIVKLLIEHGTNIHNTSCTCSSTNNSSTNNSSTNNSSTNNSSTNFYPFYKRHSTTFLTMLANTPFIKDYQEIITILKEGFSLDPYKQIQYLNMRCTTCNITPINLSYGKMTYSVYWDEDTKRIYDEKERLNNAYFLLINGVKPINPIILFKKGLKFHNVDLVTNLFNTYNFPISTKDMIYILTMTQTLKIYTKPFIFCIVCVYVFTPSK